jgi:hypothetical protein
VECLGHDVLLLHAGGHRLARVETLDATVIADVEISGPLRGLGWVTGELWSSSPGQLCRLDPLSGRIDARVALPAEIDVLDLAGDAEGHAWCVDGRSRVVRELMT